MTEQEAREKIKEIAEKHKDLFRMLGWRKDNGRKSNIHIS